MNRKKEVSALLSKARVAEQKGDYAASFFNLGSALALSDQFEEAADAYRKAVRIAPHVAAAHCGLADALVRLGKFDEAEVDTATRSCSSRTSFRPSTTLPAACSRRETPRKRSSSACGCLRATNPTKREAYSSIVHGRAGSQSRSQDFPRHSSAPSKSAGCGPMNLLGLRPGRSSSSRSSENASSARVLLRTG